MMSKLHNLQLPDNIIFATYIWIGHKKELRSKSKTITVDGIVTLDTFPEWDYDGSSTQQATGHNSEVLLQPVQFFRDPFRCNGYLVLCETLDFEDNPHPDNKRRLAMQIFNKYQEQKPWFGLEQEFFIFKRSTHNPSGQIDDIKLSPQGQYYCSVGASNCFTRQLMEDFYKASIYAGLTISGINAEVAPSQWEYQVGPCEGIEQGDQLWVSRYILQRIAETYNYDIDFSPKPIKGDINGSGCHTNFSTLKMRQEGGLEHIIKSITKLKNNHHNLINIYGGEDNKERLTGKHETASWKTFSWGFSDRGSTIRIGRKTEKEGKGYMEIRSVASNCDPYEVTSQILHTIMQ